ncbi:imidazole glycerol phosphate synthase subunit HisH [Hyphomonas johnsonii]|uniref:Imidazole glycerol phosphate synthase subunit HisH n=1 Tax=Hyphomonas johnsonii MHS-2 TaxID=1280950 RepID=A0A059FM18_9PROT|nr:imidazole glycerol phosphate synthase subunit HisH [Hyphomonas johnsonii]KCZ91730.1 imidazoleglycerol phosphate synthase, glutamine amidotransferase subunit [Hyphomonas johnsonii MHS-2]
MNLVALIDYGSGNVHSAAGALAEAARRANLTIEVTTTADPATIARADRIILPGVGHYADCAANLHARPGLVDALESAVMDANTPFLGICVGMQLLADFGLEDGETRGLGWIHGVVDRIEPGPGHAIPHVGWNELYLPRPHPVLDGLGEDPHAYFTHSYAISPEDPAHVAATTEYGVPFTSAVARDNIFGTQFHPEMSQRVGLQLLTNFLQWTP